MTHLALLLLLVQEPTPEKVFEAYAAELERLTGAIQESYQTEAGQESVRTPERIQAVERRLASLASPGVRLRQALEVVERTVNEGARVELKIREVYITMEPRKEPQRREGATHRAVLVREQDGWKLTAFEWTCGICSRQGDCAACKGKGATDRLTQIPSLDLCLMDAEPGIPADRSTPRASAGAYVEMLKLQVVKSSRIKVEAVTAAIARWKPLVSKDVAAGLQTALDAEVAAGRKRAYTAEIESISDLGEAVLAVSAFDRRWKTRVVFSKRGDQWLAHRESSECLVCEGKQKDCVICKGTGWETTPYYPPTPKELKALARETMALVEKETGVGWGRAEPVLKVSTRAEVVDVLSGELVPQAKLLAPGQPPKRVAKELAQVLSRSLVGKYEPVTDTMHLIFENLEPLSKMLGKPEVLEDGYLRTVLIHELVHASDQRAYDAVGRYAKAKSTEELSILSALVEGHAQFVTKRILAAEGREADFRFFESLILAGSPGMSEGEKVFAAIQTAELGFAYLDGRAFFDGLAKSGRKEFVADAFAKPPKKVRVIMHPEEFYAPRELPPARDLSKLWETLKADHEDGDFKGTVSAVSEAQINAAVAGLVDGAEAKRVMAEMVAGHALVVVDPPQSKMILVQVLQMTGDDEAGRAMKLIEGVSKAKDEKMKTGNLRIDKADYGTLATESAPKAVWARKTISYQGHAFPVSDIIVIVGSFMVEILHSNIELDEAGAKAILETVAKGLKEAAKGK